MKLLYCDAPECGLSTMKYLLLLGSEVCFMDRPSVTFNNLGTIARPSDFRRINPSGSPVPLNIYETHQGSGYSLYSKYIEADFTNPDFVNTVFDGLLQSTLFTDKCIQLQADYGNKLLGHQIKQSLLDHKNEILIDDAIIDPTAIFKVSNKHERINTFKMILMDISIQLTTALLIAEKYEALPISDDPYFAKLISLRLSHNKYLGGVTRLTPYLGLELAKSVIPDELLQKISVDDVLEYRLKSENIYKSWLLEMNQAAAKISDLDASVAPKEIQKIITIDFLPKMKVYNDEMINIRDTLFKDLIEQVVTWNFPALSLAYNKFKHSCGSGSICRHTQIYGTTSYRIYNSIKKIKTFSFYILFNRISEELNFIMIKYLLRFFLNYFKGFC